MSLNSNANFDNLIPLTSTLGMSDTVKVYYISAQITNQHNTDISVYFKYPNGTDGSLEVPKGGRGMFEFMMTSSFTPSEIDIYSLVFGTTEPVLLNNKAELSILPTEVKHTVIITAGGNSGMLII